ncbi:MAG TPA: DUF1343 domain-containing protein [Elusimicrobia bacterium]|nr:DUF1343 domain-containing protein [Elusimicrobiota bacterium]HBT61019.1 DUF1343 domain-containing protein [Elusimicrobiota bacterium]
MNSRIGCALLALALTVWARPAAGMLAGVDVLERSNFAALQGKRVGIITNQTGVDWSGRSTVDVLHASKKLTLVAIFSPEHGFRGNLADGVVVDNSVDPATGLPIYSLYGKTKRPTDSMLKGIDVLVFDIQDVGARFYTFLTTMGYCMEEASKRGIEFVVLDRPNPLGGATLEGPVLEGPFDFTGYYPVPVRHGLTAGEMALLHAEAKGLKLKLSVIALQGWTRDTLHDGTGYRWINPSPNIRSLDAALLYPGIGCFESTNVSVGRGTDSPFLWFGAPWLDAQRLVRILKAAALPGVRFRFEARTPTADLYAGQACQGISIEILDRRRLRGLDIFVHAVCALRDIKAESFRMEKAGAALMVGSNIYRAVFSSQDPPKKILADFEKSWRPFDAARKKFLLY